jgi:D-beta-D-heptose 7-phosphate kinase/D-beta-D-heptose 1-phosphate adenosyltransferase
MAEKTRKTKSVADLKPVIKRLQAEGKTVVWTNGCFDILHVGHVMYLEKAAREGDILVVGLNSDESVRRLKGPNRPIVPENERAFVLAALECVSFVTVFSEPTPAEILQSLHPDVYAKGGDYTIDTIVQEERRIVEGYGGRIAIISGLEGRSTTAIIDKILEERDG